LPQDQHIPSIDDPARPNRKTLAIDPPDPGQTVETGNPEGGILLYGDKYDRDKFALLNDSEFTELLSSIEGVGVEEFFIIYEELKDVIPPGELDIAISSPDNIFALLKEAVAHVLGGDSAAAIPLLTEINAQTVALSELISNATPNSHAYLVQVSSKYVTLLNEKFKAIFDYLILLINANIALTEENERLKREVEELRRKNEELTNALRRLTAPEPFGFHVSPELFTVETIQGPVALQPGIAYEVVVCGSTGATVAEPGVGFENDFTITRDADISSTKWFITPHDTLRGKTAYVTFKDVQGGSTVDTENVVFTMPPTPSGGALTLSNNVVTLYYLKNEYRTSEDAWKTFSDYGYVEEKNIDVFNAVPPITYVIDTDLPSRPYIVEIVPTNEKVSVVSIQALTSGDFPNSLRMVDSIGQLGVVSVKVIEIDLNDPFLPPPE